MSYAETTTVPIERSRAEIESVLRRYGADQFFSGWDAEAAFISFRAQGRMVRFTLAMPKLSDKRFTQDARARSRSVEAARKAWEQACRQKWRALLLAIKAKLETVEAGIATFETEFLAYIVLPDNTLVGDRIRGAIQTAYETGKVLMLGPAPGDA